jgi:hypothetical protein
MTIADPSSIVRGASFLFKAGFGQELGADAHAHDEQLVRRIMGHEGSETRLGESLFFGNDLPVVVNRDLGDAVGKLAGGGAAFLGMAKVLLWWRQLIVAHCRYRSSPPPACMMVALVAAQVWEYEYYGEEIERSRRDEKGRTETCGAAIGEIKRGLDWSGTRTDVFETWIVRLFFYIKNFDLLLALINHKNNYSTVISIPVEKATEKLIEYNIIY